MGTALTTSAQQMAAHASWPEEKCRRYQRAWSDMEARLGLAGLSPEFLSRHQAFIAGGCTGAANVCPRSPREFEIANIMTVLAMNAGMASTFLLFACPAGSKAAPPR
jgi:hypothetical protein